LINLIIEENMLSKWISVKYDGDVDWIDLAWIRDKWRDLVKSGMNIQIP
jgi:hypothetical protein